MKSGCDWMRQTEITLQTKEMLTYVQTYVERLYCTHVCDECVRGVCSSLVCVLMEIKNSWVFGGKFWGKYTDRYSSRTSRMAAIGLNEP